MCEVMVLHARLRGEADAERDAALLEQLPYGYRLELERRSASTRAASLRGVRLLAEGVRRLRGVPLALSRLHYPQGGKPTLDDGPWFSLSHSATRLAVALSDVCEVGLDLEDLGGQAWDAAALERWTAIEATLKATGSGVALARRVKLAPDGTTAELAGTILHTQALRIAPDCVARLATRVPVTRVRVEEGDGG